MTLDVRPVASDDELQRYLEVAAIAFGSPRRPPTAAQVDLAERIRDRDRTLVAVADGRIEGGCFAYDLRLTVPGGAAVPVAGLAGVAVDPTRTGRGLLRAIMAAHLDDARRRGEVASTLLASESGLYRRFGYGWATSAATYEARSAEAVLRPPPDDPGSLELLVERTEARAAARQVYGEVAGSRAGTTSRSEAWWDAVFADEATWLGGGPQMTVVHRDADGRLDGYLLYSVRTPRPDGHWVPDSTVVVRELVALDLAAELALWRYVTSVPLSRSVRVELAPVDWRVRWHLADPRQLRTVAAHDLLWVCVLDVPGMLEARYYRASGRVSFHLDAPDDPAVHGAWTLEADQGRARVTRGGSGSVGLQRAVLGSVVLGGATVLDLAGAGLVAGPDAEVRLLSALLATDDRPFCISKF